MSRNRSLVSRQQSDASGLPFVSMLWLQHYHSLVSFSSNRGIGTSKLRCGNIINIIHQPFLFVAVFHTLKQGFNMCINQCSRFCSVCVKSLDVLFWPRFSLEQSVSIAFLIVVLSCLVPGSSVPSQLRSRSRVNCLTNITAVFCLRYAIRSSALSFA